MFYRTRLQYESLEGCMILENPSDDTLSDKIGCPLYTAPELLCTTPTYQGKPADMWSLGVILYTMLVGQYPFYEKGSCSLIQIIRMCNVYIPSSLSRPVRWLILALLQKRYRERLRIDQIFLVPWMQEQRPEWACIPYDVMIKTFADPNHYIENLCFNEMQKSKRVDEQEYSFLGKESIAEIVARKFIMDENSLAEELTNNDYDEETVVEEEVAEEVENVSDDDNGENDTVESTFG